MENFTIESRYRKFYNEFRTAIRCMRAALYRLDDKKLLMCPLIKTLDRAFVSKHVAEPLKSSAELLKHSAELLKL